jgi:hypothetical protein
VDYTFAPSNPALYVDGGVIGPTSSSTAAVDLSSSRGLYVDGIGATVSDVLVYNNSVALLAAGVLDLLWSAANNGGSIEPCGTRMGRLLTAAGVPAGLQDVTTDPSVYCGGSYGGGSYGSQCKQVEAAEGGRFTQAGDGKMTFRSYVWATTATAAITSQGTFGDLASAGEMGYSDLVVDAGNIDDITNEVTVSIASGASTTIDDTASQAVYGIAARSVSAPLASVGDAGNLARRIIGKRAWPTLRVERLTLNPLLAPSTMFPQALGRAIGERITVKRRPASSTVPIVAQVTIEGVQHIISPQNWETVWTTAPAPPTATEAGYFTADHATLGVVDSGVVVA